MRTLLAIAIVLFTILFCLAMFVGIAHGQPTTKEINSDFLGIHETYSNPNVYLFAAASKGVVFRDEDGRIFTSMLFQPYHTISLYTESVLFCGNVAPEFSGKHGALIVTYQRLSHRSTGGVGCHIIQSVFEVKEEQLQ
jgi:hypothetical protein